MVSFPVIKMDAIGIGSYKTIEDVTKYLSTLGLSEFILYTQILNFNLDYDIVCIEFNNNKCLDEDLYDRVKDHRFITKYFSPGSFGNSYTLYDSSVNLEDVIKYRNSLDS